MMQRVRQFFQAIRAQLSAADRCFIAEHLPEKVQPLFWGMTLPDQCHALRVARTAMALAEQKRLAGLDLALLLRASLLHDIGRQRGDMGTFDKVFAVLLYGVVPQRAAAWAVPGRGTGLTGLRHALYIYGHHPAIGARRLQQAGLDREAMLAAGHHKAPAESDPPELLLLRQADAMN